MEHNGITITFNDRNGKFIAVKNGEELSSTSLAGIKKKLDGKDTFVPFDAYHQRYGVTETVKVIGVKKSRASWRGDEFSITREDGRPDTTYNVIEKTAANKKLIETLKRERAKFDELKTAHESEMSKLEAQITRISPPKREK